jgi:hypothetical protein
MKRGTRWNLGVKLHLDYRMASVLAQREVIKRLVSCLDGVLENKEQGRNNILHHYM